MRDLIESVRTSDPGEGPHRRLLAPGKRWKLLAGLAAVVVAALVLGLVLLTRGDDGEGNGGPAAEPEPTESPAGPAGSQLTWAPPTLERPKTLNITEDDTSLELDDDRDYRIVLPDDGLVSEGGMSIKGGNDVVLIGGRIEARERALYLIDQTGTVHVEGLSIGGEGLQEGINLDQRKGATVQLQNIHVDMVTGEEEAHHADLLQVWAGPARLLIDGFTGTTGYQGFFMLPRQFGDEDPVEWDFRRVDITGNADAAYLMWTHDEAPWIRTTDVVVRSSNQTDRDKIVEGDLDGVIVGAPQGAVAMPGGEPGAGYESPGYTGS